MKKECEMAALVFGALALFGGLPLFAAETLYTWKAGTGYPAPTNAANWNLAGNWTPEDVPNDAEAYATLTAGTYFITSAVPVSVSRIDCGSGTSLNSISYISDEEFAIKGRNMTSKGLWLFAPVRFSAGGGSYAGPLNLCGNVTIDDSCYLLAYGGRVNFYNDRFADSHSDVRVASELLTVRCSGGYDVVFQCPRCTSSDSSIQCDIVEGSPYVYVPGATATSIAVGANVVGTEDVVHDGTFVKRIFNGRWLELSLPARKTLSSKYLQFNAFAPVFRQRIKSLGSNGATSSSGAAFFFNKYSSADSAEIEIDSLALTSASASPVTLNCSGGYYPARIVIHDITSADDRVLRINKADILFSDSTAFRGPGLPYGEVSMVNANSEAKFSVTGSMVAVVRSFTNVAGSVRKGGTGTLRVGMGSSVNSGSLTVEEGTYAVSNDTESAAASIGSLAVSNGAAFKVPVQGFSAGTAEFAAGAVLSLPLTSSSSIVPLTVTGSTTLANGGIIDLVGDVDALDAGDYVLVSGGVTGSASDWHLSDPTLVQKGRAEICVMGGNLVLRYQKLGLMLIVW